MKSDINITLRTVVIKDILRIRIVSLAYKIGYHLSNEYIDKWKLSDAFSLLYRVLKENVTGLETR